MDKEKLIAHFLNSSVEIENIIKAQDIARDCLSHMRDFLKPGMNMERVHQECERYMLEKGSEGWWTHNDPALILFGDLTNYSAHLSPVELIKDKQIRENDLITIDVAPMIGKGWGDMARSYVMEEGRIIDWKDCRDSQIREGMEMEMKLHELFVESVRDDTTFAQLHRIVDGYLNEHGYCNCDYHGNFGHTIENHPDERITISEGMDIVIATYDKPITFEPHICRINGTAGLKYENMYVYLDGKMREL